MILLANAATLALFFKLRYPPHGNEPERAPEATWTSRGNTTSQAAR